MCTSQLPSSPDSCNQSRSFPLLARVPELAGGALVVFSTHTQGGAPKFEFFKLRYCKAAMDIPGRQVLCSDARSVDAASSCPRVATFG